MMAASAVNVLNVSAANAQPHGGGYHGSDFHGREYHNFSPAEREIWRSGHWEHGWHDNRYAWWWSAGGGWCLYPPPSDLSICDLRAPGDHRATASANA
jgi:hypothetical protein